MSSIQEIINQVQERDLVSPDRYDGPKWGDNIPFDDVTEFHPVTRLPDGCEFDYDPGDGDEDTEGNLLDPETRQRVEDEVEEDGIEALAYYIPFHSNPSIWGIYIRETGLAYSAGYLIHQGTPQSEAVSKAGRFLQAHEKMHFYTEVICTHQEFAGEDRVYLNRKHRAQLPLSKFSIEEFEEALANADAIRQFTNPIKSLLIQFTKTQPPGYRDWEEVSWRDDFQDGCSTYFNATG